MFKIIIHLFWILYLGIFIAESVVEGSSPTQEECSHSYLGRQGQGVITSYNYPFNYLHNLTCTYSIYITNDLESTNVICFTFHRFALESSSPFCTFDYLTMEYPNLKYCAAGLWMYGVQTTAPGSNVWSKDFCWTVKNTQTFDITFSSDNSISGAGFYAEYFIFPGEENERILPPGNLGQAPCASDEWTCFNRRCIDESQLCDGTDNCGDNSDESYVHARCGEQNVLACDFTTGSVSDGYCGFTHEGWFRTRENSMYRPQGDHTNGTSGFYVYSDVNQSSAYLISPELSLPRNKTYCLSFWYYIYGRPSAAVLRVYVTRDQAYSRPEWSRSKTPENEWAKGEIVIHSLADIQIIFEAELDNSFSGVALDDVSILPGSCLGDDISCNFELGTCSWHSLSQISHLHGNTRGDLSWRSHSRTIGATGPAWDHSSKDGGGHYLFVSNANTLSTDNRALLQSPPISAFYWTAKCLNFWYHMSGQDRDCCQLKVRIHEADDTLTDAVWMKNGDVRNAWKEAHVNLNIDRPFQIVIEGLISSNSHSQIAIDQIVLKNGHCTSTGGTACEPWQYLCVDGACINSTRRCDGVQDCMDGSDEDWRAQCPSVTPVLPPSAPTVSTPGRSTEPHVPPPTCPSGSLPCQQGGECVALDRLCDRYEDCSDGSDESTCTVDLVPCRGNLFLCRNERCISTDKKCDGIDNCGDNSDEYNCQGTTKTPVVTTCASDQFLCRADRSCIPDHLMCDGVENCADGSDETGEYAGCAVVLPSAAVSLGTGAIVGIAVGCLLCIIIIIISAILGRRRRKHQPRRSRHSQRSANPNGRSDISTISEPSTIERHMNMLDAIRSPMRNLSGLPPYSEQDLENMGYTSDGNMTLSRPVAGVVFPPEEPPPPYDSVIKEPGQGARTSSTASTPLSTPRQTTSGNSRSSRPNTPEDDSYGFRSRSSSGRAARRKSRERTHARSQQNDRQGRVSPANVLETRSQTEPNMEIPIPGPSDDSDTQNIYEELNVATLRPNQLRQEPSSSLQNPPPSHQQQYPGLPLSGLPPNGLPPSGLTPGLPPSGYGYNGNPSAGPNQRSAADTTLPHPPVRTLPHQRIRLGTQALGNRQGSGTYRPRTLDQSSPDHDQLRGSIRGYEPLESTGPYTLQRNPYRGTPSPANSNSTTGSRNNPATQNLPEDLRRTNESPHSFTGIPAQNQPLRPEQETPLHGRMYASDRNPPKNFAANSQRPHATLPLTEITQNRSINDSDKPNNNRGIPQDTNPALSLRAMPDPRPYNDSQVPRSNAVPSPLQVDNYLFRPREIGAKNPNPKRVPVDHIRGGPDSIHYPADHTRPAIGGVAGDTPRGGLDNRLSPVDYGKPSESPFSRTSPAAGNHSRDWNNSSFASTGSQEQLINSPPAASGGPSRYASHLRNGSNISSDLDSTSPLVSARDRDRDCDRESNNIELEMLTPTSV